MSINRFPLTRPGDRLALDALDAHLGSALEFHAHLRRETALTQRVAQWMEWFDILLAPRFATSVMLVGAIALVIALFA
jgi:hypothetical protein